MDGYSTPSPNTPPPPVMDLTIYSDDLPTPTKYSPLPSPFLLSPTTRETSSHQLTHLVDQLKDHKISEEERSSCLARLLSLKVGRYFKILHDSYFNLESRIRLYLEVAVPDLKGAGIIVKRLSGKDGEVSSEPGLDTNNCF